jgi:hypothetical protein
MIEGLLRRHAGEAQAALRQGLIGVVLSVFDRYPIPAALGDDAWRKARDEIVQALNRTGIHQTKKVFEIPERYAQRYFELMPIHELMRSEDLPTMRSYLRITLTNIHDMFSRRADISALAPMLIASGKSAE